MSEATRPPKIKDLRTFESALGSWEEKLKVLKLQFGEELSNWMKVAVLTDMLPNNIQDYVYTHVDKGTTFDALREKLRAVVSNKVAHMSGPAPMDIGATGEEEQWWDEEGQSEEVGWVSPDVVCSRCKGLGHYARDCATPSPSASGVLHTASKGKGKAKGKGGDGKGGGKGPAAKGKGKGAFLGTCWNCNKRGHSSNECPNPKVANSVEEEMEVSGEGACMPCGVGGVWVIGAVDADTSVLASEESGGEGSSDDKDWTTVPGNFPALGNPVVHAVSVQLSNNFETLRKKSGGSPTAILPTRTETLREKSGGSPTAILPTRT